MTYAVGDHMHEHLLARHTARGAVRKREVDPFGQSAAIERRHIVDVFPVASLMSADRSSSVGISLELADAYA